MEYHYAYAANETRDARDERMMNRETYSIYVPLKSISNDLRISGRRQFFLEEDDLKLWKDYFDWLFDKYGKMLKKPGLKVFMLVGTIGKQRNKLLKEIAEKSAQTSLFSVQTQDEIAEMNEEVKRINVLEKICYEDIDRFFEFFYHE